MRISSNRKGFTIIEVVIVLALAAFIFTIVFFAVPQLQRALRDNQRGSDASRVLTEVLNYQSQNDGEVPSGDASTVGTTMNDFVTGYLAGLTLDDPSSGDAYTYSAQDLDGGATATDPASGDMRVYASARCDGETAIDSGNARDVAVVTPRDNGTTYICRDSN